MSTEIDIFAPIEVVEGEVVTLDLFEKAPADLIDRYGPDLEQSTVDEARKRSERIRAGLVLYVHTREAIAEAWARRDWKTLGYDKWDDYLDGEFGEQLGQLRLATGERRESVAAYREQGMPIRAIAGAVHADPKTVMKDLLETPTPAKAADPNGSAEAPKVTGVDGKKYPSKREPKPDQSPSTRDKPKGADEKPAAAARPEDRPGYWSPEDRRKHEEEVQVQKDRESAHAFAERIVHQVRTYVVTITTGYRLGERGLVTPVVIAELRDQIDKLEREMLADAQR